MINKTLPLSFGLLFLHSVALAAAPVRPSESTGPEPANVLPIYGGAPVPGCGWPSMASGYSCGGTLIHPRVVVTAAHCADPLQWWFGQDIKNRKAMKEGLFADVEKCTNHPDWVDTSKSLKKGIDVKVCVLKAPLAGVPIVPMIMGCETKVVDKGHDAVLVGTGTHSPGASGSKNAVTAPINGVNAVGEVDIGGSGKDTCNGDSGGPVFVQLKLSDGFDDTWRLMALTSYGKAIGSTGCGKGGFYTPVWKHAAWIEKTSGFDVTPCHDADGTWHPTAECGNFPKEPAVLAGTWPMCGGFAGPQGGMSATCGVPFGGAADGASEGGHDGGVHDAAAEAGAGHGHDGAVADGAGQDGAADDSDGGTTNGGGCAVSGGPGSRGTPCAMLLLGALVLSRRASRRRLARPPWFVFLFVGALAAAAPRVALAMCGDVLIVLDRSGSMSDCKVGKPERTKEEITKEAINKIIEMYPTVPMGLAVFPDTLDLGPAVCGIDPVTACKAGKVVLEIAPDGGNKIKEFLAAMPESCGGTPTGTTLEIVRDYMGWLPDKDHFVIVLTDGQPTCEDGGEGGFYDTATSSCKSGPVCSGGGRCECTNPTKVYDAITALGAKDIHTFVIGFEGTGSAKSCGKFMHQPFDPKVLDKMAELGGEPQEPPAATKYYSATDSDTLITALKKILGKVVGETIKGCARKGGKEGGSDGAAGAGGGAAGGGSGGGGAGGTGAAAGQGGAAADGGLGEDDPTGRNAPGCGCRMDPSSPPWGVLVLAGCAALVGAPRTRRRGASV